MGRTKNCSERVSLPLTKEKKSLGKNLFDICEAAIELNINEMKFRQFLAQNIFDIRGMPKKKFLERGYFLIYSKKMELPNGTIFTRKTKITKVGLIFFNWLININTLYTND